VTPAVVLGAVTAAFHLATAGVWGFHRDEFYYLACGRRLAWGFVDHPPITPALFRVQELLFGASQFGLRVAPALIHGATVVVTALLANVGTSAPCANSGKNIPSSKISRSPEKPRPPPFVRVR
jgi:hypothetical protein